MGSGRLETAGMTLKATARRALASHAPINLAAYRALREAQALGANLTLEEDGATVLIQADAQIDEELLDRLIAVKPHLINLLILGYAKLESQDA